MLLLDIRPFGLTIVELAVLAAAVAYVVSLAKDFRPMRSLRAENRELRGDLNHANRRISNLEEQNGALKREVDDWKSRTDMSDLREEHKEIVLVLKKMIDQLDHLDSAVKANTAATELVARQAMVKEALQEHERDQAA